MRMPEGGLKKKKKTISENKNTTQNKQACKDCVDCLGFFFL